MEVGTKGGEKATLVVEVLFVGGRGGAGEKDSDVFSQSRISDNEDGLSQGGGTMLALRWRFSRRASQRGRVAR